MMFSLAGIISFKMLPHDRSKRYFAKNGKGGVTFSFAVEKEGLYNIVLNYYMLKSGWCQSFLQKK